MRKLHLRDEQKGGIFLGLILLIIVSVVVYFLIYLNSNEDFETKYIKNTDKDTRVIRTLLLVDDDERNSFFTNMLIYYPETQKAASVNVPGNTGAIYSSLGRVDRIDAVYKEKGIEEYIKEIEKILKCEIPFYLVMDLNNFKKVTDMLGGLRVFIPDAIDVTDNSGNRFLLPSGAVTLDGDKIEAYLKYVLPDETYIEVQDRYQNVATAFFSALHDKRSVIFNSNGVSSTFKKYYKYLETSLDSVDYTYKLLKIISEMDTETISRISVSGKLRSIDGAELLMPTRNGEDIKEAVQQVTQRMIANSGEMASRTYVLEIQNGTTTRGLAHNTAVLYRGASYDVLEPVNAVRNDYDKTVIIDHIGNREMAEMVGKYIHCTNVVEESVDLNDNNEVANVDFTIILGKDFDGRYVH